MAEVNDGITNNDLPNGWIRAAVGQLGHVQLGKMLDRAKNSGTSLAYLRNINVRWFGFDLNDLKTVPVSEDERERFSVWDGDLFICEGGEPGRSAVWKGGKNDLVYQKALHRFRTNGAIVPEMLLYRLRLEAVAGSLHESFSGSTIKHFTREALVKYQVPLAPLAEQKRIADKLELVLGRVDACRARLDRVPALLKRFRQSILAAATSGKLTEEWRMTKGSEDSKESQAASRQINDKYFAPSIWKLVSFGMLADMITSGSRGWADYYSSSGAIFIRAQNINSDRLNLKDVAFVALPKQAEGKRAIVERDDLLITITGANVGKSARVQLDLEEAYISQHIALIKLKDRSLAAFLELFLWAENSGRDQLNETAYGGGKPGLNLQNIRDLAVALPPIPEQQEIVRRVEALFVFADRIEARLATAQKTVERLTPATLAKAFRGELVPQDPSDEPAEVLLERLRSHPAAKPVKAKRSKRL